MNSVILNRSTLLTGIPFIVNFSTLIWNFRLLFVPSQSVERLRSEIPISEISDSGHDVKFLIDFGVDFGTDDIDLKAWKTRGFR